MLKRSDVLWSLVGLGAVILSCYLLYHELGDISLDDLADSLLANPGDKATLGQWAARIGMSERSMTRLLLEESGLSFGRWRRQLHVILSLQRLARGESVQRVALDLGYENASGFITMFRKAVGQPPARYLAGRVGVSTSTEAPAAIALHSLQALDQR